MALYKRFCPEFDERTYPFEKGKKCQRPPMDGWGDKKVYLEKKRAWKKWKETKKLKDQEEYKKKVAETKKKIRKRKNGHERKVAECRRTNPKMFYAFVNRAKKV